MDTTLLLIGIFPGLLLILFGYLIRFRKMYFLISGYNTMSSEKKKKVDTEGLGRLMGNCLFVMGGLMMVGMTLMAFGQSAISLAVLLMILPLVTYLLISAQKYDGNTRNESGRMKTSVKILLAGIILLLVLLVGWAGYSLLTDSKATAVQVDSQSIRIEGAYGVTIDRAQITRITLQESLPKILLRTNGSAIGSRLRGHFKMETLGAVRLYINKSIPPFIVIESADRPIIFNLGTAEETKVLYESLMKK